MIKRSYKDGIIIIICYVIFSVDKLPTLKEIAKIFFSTCPSSTNYNELLQVSSLSHALPV